MSKSVFYENEKREKIRLMMNLETGLWEYYDEEKLVNSGFSYDVVTFEMPKDQYYFLDLSKEWPILRWCERGNLRKQKRMVLWKERNK